jgi:hypothetical protein
MFVVCNCKFVSVAVSQHQPFLASFIWVNYLWLPSPSQSVHLYGWHILQLTSCVTFLHFVCPSWGRLDRIISWLTLWQFGPCRTSSSDNCSPFLRTETLNLRLLPPSIPKVIHSPHHRATRSEVCLTFAFQQGFPRVATSSRPRCPSHQVSKPSQPSSFIFLDKVSRSLSWM